MNDQPDDNWDRRFWSFRCSLVACGLALIAAAWVLHLVVGLARSAF